MAGFTLGFALAAAIVSLSILRGAKMQISVAEVRRILAPGKTIIAQYLRGDCHTSGPRKIVRQTSSAMVSECLDGPKIGNKVYCDWPGVIADLSDTGEITLAKDPLGEFVRFKIVG
jgi:hypothetical protein